MMLDRVDALLLPNYKKKFASRQGQRKNSINNFELVISRIFQRGRILLDVSMFVNATPLDSARHAKENGCIMAWVHSSFLLQHHPFSICHAASC